MAIITAYPQSQPLTPLFETAIMDMGMERKELTLFSSGIHSPPISVLDYVN